MTEPATYRQLAALAHAGHRLAAVGSADEAIDAVVRMTRDLVDGDSASLGRVDPARGVLRILRNVGDLATWEQQWPEDETYPLADFPQLRVAPERTMAWCGSLDDATLREPERRLLRALGKHSMLAVPLVVDREIWGMVSAMRSHERPSFDAVDLAAAEALAGMVGGTLARMEERDVLAALAYRDALTGLGNRRSVDDRLEAVFSQDPLPAPAAVILCDVDGLKSVNDEQGHAAGDRLLRDIAHLLSREAGRYPGTLAARLGGDEFCLVMEGVEEHELELITRRLTEQAAALELGRGLSCGFAVTQQRPGDAATSKTAARALLRLADAAQYRVKRAGREVRSYSSAWQDGEATVRSVSEEAVELALRRLRSTDGTLVARLSAVATALHDVTDAGAWAVSRSVDAGPITIERNLDRPRPDRGDGQVYAPGVAFDLDDYPATRDALAGGSFHATLISGDPAERGFLAASGYTEMVAAGRTVGREAWLVEICGDALSAPLVGLEPLVRLLVELAVEGASADTGLSSAPPRSNAGSSA